MKTRRLNVRSATWGKDALWVILCTALGTIPCLVEIPNGSGGSRDLHTTDLQCALQYRT